MIYDHIDRIGCRRSGTPPVPPSLPDGILPGVLLQPFLCFFRVVCLQIGSNVLYFITDTITADADDAIPTAKETRFAGNVRYAG